MPYDLNNGGLSYKKKSGHGWTLALWLLIMVATIIAGFHFGGKQLLKQQQDQRAVEMNTLPITLPQLVSGDTDNILWRDVRFEDGLQCRLFKAKNGGAGPDFIKPDAVSCNWSTYTRR